MLTEKDVDLQESGLYFIGIVATKNPEILLISKLITQHLISQLMMAVANSSRDTLPTVLGEYRVIYVRILLSY